ncbi:hypothetical protein A3C86_03155 [Candidatus Kaiserbacteria bacterium RIFCSPHIGHO2_02_FULL_49_16]|uniref:GGDEF domain-containing protein n=1 Tax=Candidatus Kaiserbacteria bacterium RIFCSPHIGHO2_02_FULL_49_16 TaxID=1798490 RepID=A0A1F6DF36_9BACT|nr:MAG: hypothetical protein A3C86_03155 [Candidatus Kaiserbacteria bacterium RIFCSPHIGHO2_02_FULL_49_16]
MLDKKNPITRPLTTLKGRELDIATRKAEKDKDQRKLEQIATQLSDANKTIKELHRTAEVEEQALIQSVELARAGEQDPLIGLASRPEFLARMQNIMQRRHIQTEEPHARRAGEPRRTPKEMTAEKERSKHVAIIFLDLDDFKQINDKYEHAAGDAVLRAIGALLMGGILRDVDVVGRWGGEEIAIGLPKTNQEEAIKVAEKIRAAIHELPIEHESVRLPAVTASLGVATTENGETLKDIIGKADKAMYAAKRAGKNQVASAQIAATEQNKE